jgi:hypothetical protein
VLRRAFAHETERIPRAENRDVEPPQEIRDRSDVILVPVRHEQPGDAVRLQRGEVRVHDVDAQAALVEGDTAIDDEHLAALLEGEAVHPDFAEPSQGEKPQERGCR